MTITITAFERSPDGGKGLARDTRVRWALEEVGLRRSRRSAARHASGLSTLNWRLTPPSLRPAFERSGYRFA